MLGRVILALDVPYGGEKEGISDFIWGKLVVGLPAETLFSVTLQY